MQSRTSRRRIAGFSLIEILLATVVLVFGLLGVMNVIDANQRAAARAGQLAQAAQLAQMKAAEFRAAGYAKLNGILGENKMLEVPAREAKEFEVNASYRWRAELIKADDRITYWIAVSHRGEERATLVGFVSP